MDGLARRLGAAVIVGLLGLVPLTAGASPTDEAQFVSLINSSRGAAGLPPLSNHGDLVDDARAHTARMIANGTIFHSTSSELSSYSSGWSLLGENVGMGPDPNLLHAAFMKSASHKANIMGAFQHVGVGADRASDGTLYVTVVFMQVATPPPTTTRITPTTAPPATAPPAAPPPTTAPPPTPAPTEAVGPRDSRVASAEPIPGHSPAQASRTLTLDIPHSHDGWGICVRIKADGPICMV